MRLWALVAVAALALAGGLGAAAAGPSSAPTTSQDPSKWIPIPLVYYLHETGMCPPLGHVKDYLDRNDTEGDAKCTYSADLVKPKTVHTLIFESEVGTPVAIPEPGRSADLKIHLTLDRPANNWCQWILPCEDPTLMVESVVKIGTATCSSKYEAQWIWWLPYPADVPLKCALSGTTRVNQIVRIELKITSNVDVVMDFDGRFAPALTLGVLVNPLVYQPQTGSLPPAESATIAVPALLASLLLVAALVRRRN